MKQNEYQLSVTRAIDIKRPSKKVQYLSIGVNGWVTVKGDTIEDIAVKVKELSDDKFFESMGSLDEMLETECIFVSDGLTAKMEARIEVAGKDVTHEYRKSQEPSNTAPQGVASNNEQYLTSQGFKKKQWPDGGVSYSMRTEKGYLNVSEKKDKDGWTMYLNHSEGGKEYWNADWGMKEGYEAWSEIYGKLNGREF